MTVAVKLIVSLLSKIIIQNVLARFIELTRIILMKLLRRPSVLKHHCNVIFQEKCPLGCPCDDYDCDLPEKKAVLTLYTNSSTLDPIPVLIQPNGKYPTMTSGLISFKVASLKILNSK